MDYGLILVIAAYLGALQLATRTNAKVLACAFVAVGLPYIVSLIIQWIITNSHGAGQLTDLFALSGVATFVLQFAVACMVFYKIQNDDGASSTIGWSIGGFIAVVVIVPFVVQLIL